LTHVKAAVPVGARSSGRSEAMLRRRIEEDTMSGRIAKFGAVLVLGAMTALAGCASQDELQNYAAKSDLDSYATKADLEALRAELKAEIATATADAAAARAAAEQAAADAAAAAEKADAIFQKSLQK
jgi:hypothetical protein